MGPIRICIPIQGTFDAIYGGGQVYVRNIANALCCKGYDVTVLECVQDSKAGRENEPQIASFDTSGRIRVLRLHLPLGGGWGGQEQVEAAVREGITTAAPDIVHAHGMKMLVARVCADMCIPCVVTAHHGGLVCPSGALLDYEDKICDRPVRQAVCTHCCISQQPLAPLWKALLSLMPRKFQQTAGRTLRRMPFIYHVTPALTTPLQVCEKKLEVQELITKASHIIAPSKAMQAALLRNGASPERTVVIPHGIPALGKVEFFDPIVRNVVRFAYVGRLSREKGLHVLIEAFNRLNGDAELHIIGKALTKREKKYWALVLAQVALPERLIQHGYLIGSDYRRVLEQCDVITLPSICLEVFGLTIAEAFSVGRPVITTDSGGPGEQVRNGLDGFIVAPNNVSALADAMQRFVDDPTMARRLERNLRSPISIGQHVDSLLTLYRRCLS